MASYMRLSLVLAVLLAGLLLVACDGDDDGDEDGAANGPTATQVADGDVEPGDEAFEDVPLPEGADEIGTTTVPGADLPYFVPPGADVDAESYGEVTVKVYKVAGSPGEVLGFYEDNRGDWEVAFSSYTGESGIFTWNRDDGARVVWFAVAQGPEAGTAAMTIAEGRLEE